MLPVTATFRFYEELNDFLAPTQRRREFSCVCARAATTKHMIEALGVPHTEVELILVNGESVGFGHVLQEGDRVAVYPKFEALDVTPLLRVRPEPLRTIRFVADAHLGGLAQLLRLAGFDTLYDNHFADDTVQALATADARIVLTRDRELLKRRTITHGCYVRELKPEAQLRELYDRLDLAGSTHAFRLCLSCNVPLRQIDKSEVHGRVPDGVFERQARFVTCDVCKRIFWEGSHWQRMRALIDSVVGERRRNATQ
ncbi:Mut7-C ubiquitin/RNAse domain-containing protein [Trinickia sp. LjRoot230]|uniref:Mut7-C RNAse domain-containing protein n=1 Tax=Trinickia sp. LjRoot230 TaxID=3342288 RepID=UPI003ECD7875